MQRWALGSGTQAVISLRECAIQAYGSDGRTSKLHADHYQNKNKHVLGYFMWRVMTGQHYTIEYLMQIPGHARCLVDTEFDSFETNVSQK